MRIKLRKNKSTLDMEQIPLDIQSLEIISESLEKMPSFVQYQNLKSLYINCPQVNSFNGFSTNLNYLKIRDGHVNLECLNSISQMRELESLTLVGTKIEELPDSFFLNLKKLTNIDIKNNSLKVLPSSIKQLKSLTRINLDQNKFTNFPQTLFIMKQINHISADHNNFNEEEKAIIHQKLGLWF